MRVVAVLPVCLGCTVCICKKLKPVLRSSLPFTWVDHEMEGIFSERIIEFKQVVVVKRQVSLYFVRQILAQSSH